MTEPELRRKPLASTRLYNALPPTAWAIVGVLMMIVAGLLLGGALQGLGFRFDPFDRTAKRADQAETRLVVSQADVRARTIETAAAHDTLRRTTRAQAVAASADRLAADFAARLDSGPPDHDPLPLADVVADRLRAADAGLCALSPRVCASPAAAPDPA